MRKRPGGSGRSLRLRGVLFRRRISGLRIRGLRITLGSSVLGLRGCINRGGLGHRGGDGSSVLRSHRGPVVVWDHSHGGHGHNCGGWGHHYGGNRGFRLPIPPDAAEDEEEDEADTSNDSSDDGSQGDNGSGTPAARATAITTAIISSVTGKGPAANGPGLIATIGAARAGAGGEGAAGVRGPIAAAERVATARGAPVIAGDVTLVDARAMAEGGDRACVRGGGGDAGEKGAEGQEDEEGQLVGHLSVWSFVWGDGRKRGERD